MVFPLHNCSYDEGRRQGRCLLPFHLSDDEFLFCHIFVLVDQERIEYRMILLHQRKNQIIHLGIICQTFVLFGWS